MALLSNSIIFLALSIIYFSENAHASPRNAKIIDPYAHTDPYHEHIKDQVVLFHTRYPQKPCCGGTIIGGKFVLTAAHCVTNELTNEFNGPYMVLANTNTLDVRELRFRIYREIKEIVIPKDYVKPVDGNDIAVLVLNETLFVPNSEVSWMHLPKPGERYDNVLAEVSGFGIDDETFPIHGSTESTWTYQHSTDLVYQNVKVLAACRCREILSDQFRDDQMCGRLDGLYTRRGICKGDSGSGLVYNDTVIGVASTTFSCNEGPGGQPSVYTRVSSFYWWIVDVMANRRSLDRVRFHIYL